MKKLKYIYTNNATYTDVALAEISYVLYENMYDFGRERVKNRERNNSVIFRIILNAA